MNTTARISRMTRTTLTLRTTFCLASLVAALAPQAQAADRVAVKPSTSRGGALKQALKIAGESRAALQTVKTYSATFSKKEIVGKKMIEQTMQLKMRHKPFSVYLKFANPHSGREVIYVDGHNDGKLVVNLGGTLGKILGLRKLEPNNRLVMKENRYPITDIGILRMLDTVVQQWEKLPGNSKVRYFPNAKLGKKSVRVIQVIRPKRSSESPFHMTRLYIDNKTRLPIRVQQYGFPRKSGGKPPLIEEYTYSNVKLDKKIGDSDFTLE